MIQKNQYIKYKTPTFTGEVIHEGLIQDTNNTTVLIEGRWYNIHDVIIIESLLDSRIVTESTEQQLILG